MKAVKPQTNPTMHQIAPQQCNYSNQSQHTAVLAPPATGPSGFWEPGTLLRPLHTTPGPQGAGGCVLGLGRQHAAAAPPARVVPRPDGGGARHAGVVGVIPPGPAAAKSMGRFPCCGGDGSGVIMPRPPLVHNATVWQRQD
ncbi:hypothetical protein PLESTM_000706800 [Pleodorina starrii]|nr:hypothetical protein PLESTM_000706800 [Pleodorina starrii]